MVLGVYINPFGLAFEGKSSLGEIFTIESCEKDILVTLVSSFLFSI